MRNIFRNHERASKNSWKTIPLVDTATKLSVEKSYHSEQWDRILHGSIPDVMEDKWFIYEEDYWLYIHRSWTGIGIFKAHFSVQDESIVLDEAYVDADALGENLIRKEKYADFLYWLIDRFLLGKESPFPSH
jgi:hypothetical protein